MVLELSQTRIVLGFLASIEKDCTGYSFALARTIQKGTGLSRAEIDEIVKRAEKNGLVETIRTNLPGPDGLISVTITEKGRIWLKEDRLTIIEKD